MIETPSHRIETARRIADKLVAASSIGVATHINGDGDGWGSACAIAHHLLPNGCDVSLLAGTPYPERLRFLLPDGLEPLPPSADGLKALESAELQIVVDASEPGRLGEFVAGFDPERTIVIDHHAVASSMIQAAEVLIDPNAAASAELVYDVFVQMGEPLIPATAIALYVGLATDTGSFRYSNATPHAHRLAAELIEAGVEPEALYAPLYGNLTDLELGVLEVALARLQRDAEHGIVWTGLSADVPPLDEYELVIDHLRNLQGAHVAVLLRDLGDGSIKASLRSNGAADVAEVARSFGGGGHRKAAGASVRGALSDVAERIIEACRAAVRAA